MEQDKFESTVVLENTPSETANILVVDDDEMILQLMKDVLTDKNYLVDTATDAESAIEMISKAHYSLALIDINIPGMTGRELFQEFKRLTPNTAVIIITGAPELNDAVNLMKEGVFDYISKPIDITKLLERIGNVLKRKSSLEIDPEVSKVIKDIPPEYNIAKVLNNNETSVVLLIEKENKYYAMKILKYETLDDQSVRKLKRFFREAKLMRTISHPNIVKVYEYRFQDNQLPFILTEYVPRSSLTPKISSEMTFNEKIIFIKKLANALWEIHKKGIIHRDIKPSNIMVTSDGEPKLTDFGIACIKDSSLTLTREILGSPRYMSPEAFVAVRGIDARADIFSFGLVIYEMLTGQRAFDGDNISQLIHSICTENPIKPTDINPDIPEHMNNILAKMLHKEPEKRYANIALAAMDLDILLKEEASTKKQSGFLSGMFKKKAEDEDIWKED